MIDPLTGARFKLRRTRKHLEELRSELAAFTAGKPYGLTHEPNADSSEHIFRAQVLKDPPPDLSVIIGDALQNMRSTLEHLAWGLTPLNTRQTSPRSIGFPIYTKESAFLQTDRKTASGYATTSGMHKIWTMPTNVRAAIQQLQPYNTGDDELWFLNELARVDRHQSLSLMGAVSDRFDSSWRKRGAHGGFGADFSIVRKAEVSIGPFEHGAKVGEFIFSESEMEVDLQLRRYVAFRDEGPARGRHVLGTLTSIRRYSSSNSFSRNRVPTSYTAVEGINPLLIVAALLRTTMLSGAKPSCAKMRKLPGVAGYSCTLPAALVCFSYAPSG